ncbi:MAG TPA: beta-phosphoglucomutase, partial [Lachnospiraceae bacterium]|nr:beta-phosphoglucomutase [Lachnospiraceae bacterium]
MKYKAVIFDLDGVICHTDMYHYQAWKAVADKLGIYFDESINNRLRGVSRMASFEIILERYKGTMSKEDKLRYTEEKNEIYKELLKNMGPQSLGTEVKDTLDRLRAAGAKLAIGSSSKSAKFILGRLGLEGYFDAVSDGNNIINSKPDPEVFVKAARFIDVPAAECLVVEDAKAGLEAAIKGGMDCAAIGEA